MITGGARLYSGRTQYGKTTRALADMEAERRQTGYPSIVLDLARARTFRDKPHEPNVNAVLLRLFTKAGRTSGASWPIYWTPESDVARNLFWRKAREWGGVHILADEIRRVCSHVKVDDAFVLLSNEWAHGILGEVFLYYTAQRIMYVNEQLFPALVRHVVFNSAPGNEQKKLRALYGDKADVNQTRNVGEADVYEDGPPAKDASGPNPAPDKA